MNQYRDTELGRKLTILDAPEHIDGYWQRLEMGLAAASVPAEAPKEELQLPAWRRAGRRRPLAFAAVGAVAVTAALVVLLVGVPGLRDGESGPEPATAAARMATKIGWAMSNARTLSGRYRLSGAQIDPTVTGTFWLTARGDSRVETTWGSENGSPAAAATLVYNAATRTLQRTEPDGTLRTQTGSWPPSAPFPLYSESSSLPVAGYQGFAAVVRALAAGEADGLVVTETTHRDRPAWMATLPLVTFDRQGWDGSGSPPPNEASPKDVYKTWASLTVAVDRETGLLLMLRHTPAPDVDWENAVGLGPYELEVSDLTVNADAPPSAFDVRDDPAATEGFVEYGDVPTVAGKAGFSPLLPTRLPDGFRLTDASTFDWYRSGPSHYVDPSVLPWVSWSALRMGGQAPAAWMATDGERPKENLSAEADIQYRRGLDWVLLRQMKTGMLAAGTTEPVAVLSEVTDPVYKWGYRKATLSGGALAGKTAHTWLGDATGSWSGSIGSFWTGSAVFIWGEDEDDLSLLITGSLSRDELLDVANSLQPFEE